MKITPDKSAVFQILTKPLGYENQNADFIPFQKPMTISVPVIVWSVTVK